MASRYVRFLEAEIAPYLHAPRKKSLRTQVVELGALWRRYRYPPYHYFKHRLYEVDAVGNPLEYVPPRLIQRFQARANPREHLRMLYDKLESNRILAARGLPCIETLFHVDADGVVRDGVGRETSVAAAVGALRRLGTSVFVKPIDDGVGHGARVVSAGEIDRAFLKRVRKVVIQPILKNHPRLERLYPRALNTVRVDTLIDGEGCAINAACLKVGTGRAAVDNWAKGGIAIGVDVPSGALAPRGIRKAAFGRTWHETHPDTGIAFAGMVVPFWPEAIALAKRAAVALRPHVTLGLDIAITPDGPVFVEANETGDFFLLQEACGPLGRTRLAERALEHRSGWLGRRAAAEADTTRSE